VPFGSDHPSELSFAERIPSTFSRKTTGGWHILSPLRMCGKRCLGSESACLRPAAEKGWQGKPPEMTSTLPRKIFQSRVLRFVHIGAASISPFSIFETKLQTAKDSISTKVTVLIDPRALLSPRSIPPYPAQRERCLSSLVLPTLFLRWSLVSLFIPPYMNQNERNKRG